MGRRNPFGIIIFLIFVVIFIVTSAMIFIYGTYPGDFLYSFAENLPVFIIIIVIASIAIGVPLTILFYVKFFKQIAEEEDVFRTLTPFDTPADTREEIQPAQEKEMVCPYCQERFKSANYCPNCGNQIN